MLRPQQTFTDINNELNLKPDAQKEYIDETTYEEQVVDMDINFADGTIKITDQIAAAAKIAVESRMNSVKDYTKERIERINTNLKQYANDTSVASDSKSLADVFFPETFNAVEDWSDDLYLMFEDMVNDLEVDDIGDNVEQFIVKSLKITEVDDEKKIGFLRSLARFLFLDENTGEEDNYYFKKQDVIKSFLKRGLFRSKFKEKVEQFLTMGVNTGLFVLKDDWGPTGEYKLCKAEGAEGSDTTKDSLKYKLDQEDVYRFHPVDPRLLIFPKHGFPWVIEKIPTTFHELLEMVIGDDGKPIEGAKYDIKMLKKLGDYLKEVGASQIKGKDHTLEGENQAETDDDVSELWDIDGNITIYECHAIPLALKGKRPYKYLISMVNLAEKEETPEMIAIGVQKTPYIAGNPYLMANFVAKDGDVSGVGLPELIRPLQTMLNNFAGHSVDILNLALWGVMVVDPTVFKDASKLKEITPRLILQLKNMKGRKVPDVVQWLKPDIGTLSSMGEMFALFQQALSRTTRKGPTGEKIAPNPSATEFESIVTELQKSVNKVGLRVNNLFSRMLERMYIYNILNMKERIKLKPQAYRIKEGEASDILSNINNGDTEDISGQYTMTDKGIELTAEELFVDGLNFKLTAADTFNKKAVEKQQAMQVTNMLLGSGAVINPDGTPHVMKDETGAPVFISEYKMYKRLLDYFDYDDIFEKIEGNDQQQLPPNLSGGEAGQSFPPNSPASPPLTASPSTGDVLQQGSTLSQGINV